MINENSNAGKSVEITFANNLKKIIVDAGIASDDDIDVELNKTTQYLRQIKNNAESLIKKGKTFLIVHIGRSNKQSDVVLVKLDDLNNMQAFEVKSSYDFSKLFNPSFKTDFKNRQLLSIGQMSKFQHADEVCNIISDVVLKDKMFRDFMYIMEKYNIDFPCSRKLNRFKDAFAEFISLYPKSFKDGQQSIQVSSPRFSSKIDEICYAYYMTYAQPMEKIPTPYMQIGNKNAFGMTNAQIFQIENDMSNIPLLRFSSNGDNTIKKLSSFFGGFIIRMRLRTRNGNLDLNNWKDPTQFNLIAELNFAKEPLGSLCNLVDETNFPACEIIRT